MSLDDEEKTSFAPSIINVSELNSKIRNDAWVKVEMKLIGWDFVDFIFVAQTDTYLIHVKKMVEKKFGRMSHLKICRGEFKEYNEMRDDMKTLKEYGIQGGSKEDPPTIKLCYDFNPSARNGFDPILLAWIN